MKKIIYILIPLLLLTSCNSPKPKKPKYVTKIIKVMDSKEIKDCIYKCSAKHYMEKKSCMALTKDRVTKNFSFYEKRYQQHIEKYQELMKRYEKEYEEYEDKKYDYDDAVKDYNKDNKSILEHVPSYLIKPEKPTKPDFPGKPPVLLEVIATEQESCDKGFGSETENICFSECGGSVKFEKVCVKNCKEDKK